MDRLTGRPDHIMDYLTRLRDGDWYGFSDNNNQVYSTLIVHDGGYNLLKQNAMMVLKRCKMLGI